MIVYEQREAVVWIEARVGVLVVGLALLAGCTSDAEASVSKSEVKGEWTLVRYTVGGDERALAADAPGTLNFGSVRVGANDSVNGMSARYSIHGDRLRLGVVETSLVGTSPDSPAANTVAAIEVVMYSDGKQTVRIGLDNGTLVVSSGGKRAEFRR